MIRINKGLDSNYEKIVAIPSLGNVRIVFWFYNNPRLSVTKVLKNGKEIHFRHDFVKLLYFFKSLIVKEDYNVFWIEDDAIDKVAEFIPTILIKSTKAERKEELRKKIVRHKEIINKLESRLAKL